MTEVLRPMAEFVLYEPRELNCLCVGLPRGMLISRMQNIKPRSDIYFLLISVQQLVCMKQKDFIS